MSSVLITGGTGFIGSRLAEACRAAGDRVRVLGQLNTEAERENRDRLAEQDVEVTLGSVVDGDVVREALEGVDVVYHLAAAQHEAGASDEHFRTVNVEGTRTMLEASAEGGIQRFVQGSTIGVYRSDDGIVQEDTPTEPDNIYGETKLEAERVVRSFRDRLPSVIVRISETYGPGDRRLLKLFRAVDKGRFVHIGPSENLHHLVYVDDLVRGLRLAAQSERALGETLVLPGAEAVTTRAMVDSIAEALDVDPPRFSLPLWPFWAAACLLEWTLRPLGIEPPLHRRRMHFFVKSFAFSGQKACALLGYEPEVSVQEGAVRTARWYRRQGLLD